jgi:hypothetical protein
MQDSVAGFCDECDEVPGSIAWNFFHQPNVWNKFLSYKLTVAVPPNSMEQLMVI